MNSFSRKKFTIAAAIAIALGSLLHAAPASAQDAVTPPVTVRFPTKVLDSKNKTVGTYESLQGPAGSQNIDAALISINGIVHTMALGDAFGNGVGVSGFSNTCPYVGDLIGFIFSGTDCTGSIFLALNGGGLFGGFVGGHNPLTLNEVRGAAGCVQNDTLYYPQAPYASNAYASIGSGSDPDHISSCANISGSAWSGTVTTFDLTKLKLTPPFKLK